MFGNKTLAEFQTNIYLENKKSNIDNSVLDSILSETSNNTFKIYNQLENTYSRELATTGFIFDDLERMLNYLSILLTISDNLLQFDCNPLLTIYRTAPVFTSL